jgi:hypothetical protein
MAGRSAGTRWSRPGFYVCPSMIWTRWTGVWALRGVELLTRPCVRPKPRKFDRDPSRDKAIDVTFNSGAAM